MLELLSPSIFSRSSATVIELHEVLGVAPGQQEGRVVGDLFP